MILRGVLLGAALVISAAASAAAQPAATPLGDVARQAEAAKATARKAKKSFTNADLSAVPISQAEPAAPTSGFMSATLGKPVSAEEMLARSEEKAEMQSGANLSEEHWRDRATALRLQIDKLQARITMLQKPNPARDANADATARNDAQLDGVRQGLASLMKQWSTLEESARIAKAKNEWLDPRPQFQ